MNIADIVHYLNQSKGYQIDSQYYVNIQLWEDWWRGYHKPFHQYEQIRPDGARVKRDLYSLRMAKKVCQDWQSILLNDKTRITVQDPQSMEFLAGTPDQECNGGVLGISGFWQGASALVEKAFYSGTGAILLKASGMTVADDGRVTPDGDAKIWFDYLSADHIIPLTVKRGAITEAAFVSDVVEKGRPYIYLESHTLEADGTYCVTNEYFDVRDGSIAPAPLPAGISPVWHTGSPYPLFALIYPNTVNHFPHSNGLGVSVFADAIDVLKGVDLAYNNLNRDFYLGGKKVFYNKELVQSTQEGAVITPDDVAQQLFMCTGGDSAALDAAEMMHEFNPSLRVAENKEGIQAQLDYLSFKCGLGTKHYQFNAGSIVTATQYMGDKQELVQNASKHYIVIEAALKAISRAVLWAGKVICGQNVDPESPVTVTFDDGYFIDDEAERARDLQEVSAGILQKYEYRMKWKGESEEEAKRVLSQHMSDDGYMGFGGDL